MAVWVFEPFLFNISKNLCNNYSWDMHSKSMKDYLWRWTLLWIVKQVSYKIQLLYSFGRIHFRKDELSTYFYLGLWRNLCAP